VDGNLACDGAGAGAPAGRRVRRGSIEVVAGALGRARRLSVEALAGAVAGAVAGVLGRASSAPVRASPRSKRRAVGSEASAFLSMVPGGDGRAISRAQYRALLDAEVKRLGLAIAAQIRDQVVDAVPPPPLPFSPPLSVHLLPPPPLLSCPLPVSCFALSFFARHRPAARSAGALGRRFSGPGRSLTLRASRSCWRG